jgi:hypothetical protein
MVYFAFGGLPHEPIRTRPGSIVVSDFKDATLLLSINSHAEGDIFWCQHLDPLMAFDLVVRCGGLCKAGERD